MKDQVLWLTKGDLRTGGHSQAHFQESLLQSLTEGLLCTFSQYDMVKCSKGLFTSSCDYIASRSCDCTAMRAAGCTAIVFLGLASHEDLPCIVASEPHFGR